MWFTACDVGWVVGHSYIVYAPLLLGATTVLYEGKPVGTPDAGAFWRVVEEHGVNAMFTAPTAIRAIRKEDPDGTRVRRARPVEPAHALPRRRATRPRHPRVGDVGAPRPGGRPLVADRDRLADRREPARARTDADQGRVADGAVPGYDVRVLDERGSRCAPGNEGSICIRLPLPPGTLPTLWHDDDRYVASYLSAFPGYYLTGDGGYVDSDGYLFVMGRTDDVINVAGHRLSTGSMEAVVAAHPAVAECAVIGVHDDLKGQVPRGLVVLKAGETIDPTCCGPSSCRPYATRSGRSPRSDVDVVPALPKTRSGKILRQSMRAIAEGREPGTVDDRGPGRPRRDRPGAAWPGVRLGRDPPLGEELGPLPGVADQPVRAVPVEADVVAPVQRRAAVVRRPVRQRLVPVGVGRRRIRSTRPWLNTASSSLSMCATLTAGRCSRCRALAAVPLVLNVQVPCRKCPSTALIRGSPGRSPSRPQHLHAREQRGQVAWRTASARR